MERISRFWGFSESKPRQAGGQTDKWSDCTVCNSLHNIRTTDKLIDEGGGQNGKAAQQEERQINRQKKAEKPMSRMKK
jgi:hypothetical protein